METIFGCSVLGCDKFAVIVGKCKEHAREEFRKTREQEAQKLEKRGRKPTEWTADEILTERMRDGWELRQGPTAVHLVKDKYHMRVHPKYFHELQDSGKLVKVGETSRGRKASIFKLKENICQTQ